MTQKEAEFEFSSVLCLMASVLMMALASAALHALAYSTVSACLGSAFPNAMPWIGYVTLCSAALSFLSIKGPRVYRLQEWLHYGRSLNGQRRLANKLATQSTRLRRSISEGLRRLQQESEAYRALATPAHGRMTASEFSHLLARLQSPNAGGSSRISEQIGKLQETEENLELLAAERFELRTRIESCPD